MVHSPRQPSGSKNISPAPISRLEPSLLCSVTRPARRWQSSALLLRSAVKRPVKELKAYRRVTLKAGEARVVRLTVKADDLRYWDPDANRWTLEAKPVHFQVGGSSADVRGEKTVNVR